jgi:hypothetical protein
MASPSGEVSPSSQSTLLPLAVDAQQSGSSLLPEKLGSTPRPHTLQALPLSQLSMDAPQRRPSLSPRPPIAPNSGRLMKRAQSMGVSARKEGGRLQRNSFTQSRRLSDASLDGELGRDDLAVPSQVRRGSRSARGSDGEHAAPDGDEFGTGGGGKSSDAVATLAYFKGWAIEGVQEMLPSLRSPGQRAAAHPLNRRPRQKSIDAVPVPPTTSKADDRSVVSQRSSSSNRSSHSTYLLSGKVCAESSTAIAASCETPTE